MSEQLIELGLNEPASSSDLASLSARLLDLIAETAVESETLDTGDFRTKLRTFRDRLANSSEHDPVTAAIARECLRLCEDFLGRARRYLLEREREFTEVIEVMRVAMGKLSGDAHAFNVRLTGSSERMNRLIEIHDIRELKRRISEEVHNLNMAISEKQKQDELNYSKLSRHIELLQANLSHSRREASIDPLTQIANRGTFDHTLKDWINLHKEARTPFILAMLDIDDFKRINDGHGHQIGDRVLCCVAQWLCESIRSSDFLARYGGEEFVVLLADLPMARAESRFRDLLAEMSRCNYSYQNGKQECAVRFTASCGLAEFNLEESEQDLIRRADDALYAAKKAGKNRVVVSKQQKSLWQTLGLRPTR